MPASDTDAPTQPADRRCAATTRTVVVILLLLLFAPGAASVRAQEETATPEPAPAKSQRELELEERKRIRTLEKDIALADQAIRDSEAKPTTTPLAGTTTVADTVNIEASILSFRAVADVSNNIACEVYERVPTARNIALFNAKDFNDWRNYKTLFPTVKDQLENIAARYDELLADAGVAQPSPDKAAPAALTGALLGGATAIRALVDLISIFRTDTEIKGVAVTVKPSAMKAEMLRALRDAYRDPTGVCSVTPQGGGIVQPRYSVSLFYPEVFSPKILDESPTIMLIRSAFFKKAVAEDFLLAFDVKDAKVKELKDAIKEVKARIAALGGQIESLTDERTDLEWELEEVRATPADGPAAEAKKRARIGRLTASIAKRNTAIGETTTALGRAQAALAPLAEELETLPPPNLAERDEVAKLRKLNEQFDKFMESFVKPDAAGNSGLAMFVKSENMEQAMDGNDSYWLQIEPVLAGGNNRTQRNFLRFFIGAKLTHSGGVVAEYVLANKKGEVLRSNTSPEYTGYRSSSRIK